MITTTWTNAPAGLLGLGGSDAPACAGFGVPFGVFVAPTVVPVQGTGLPAVGSAARLRQDFPQVVMTTGLTTREHNYIGTTNDVTLGIHSSRRPQS